MLDRVPSPVIRYRLPLIVFLHALFAAVALTMSFLVRFDFSLGPDRYVRLFLLSLPINVAIFVGVSAFFNLFQGIWRYVSVDDLRDIFKAALVAGLVFAVIMMLDRRHFSGYPRSIYAMNIVFFILLNGGTRFAIRTFRESFAPMSSRMKNTIFIA